MNINDNTNLTIQIDIKNDQFIPTLTNGDLKDLKDKTTILIALHQLQKDILNCEDINDLNERFKNV